MITIKPFPKFKIVGDKLIDEVASLKFSEESFKKFDDPKDPQYEDYKDRDLEKWHDQGWNNAVDCILRILIK